MYPDAYEVGLPNQGLMILYEVLNERPDALAERTYAVWPDLAALMRANGVPQFTVDGHRAVADFDLLGVSFATELGYTNLLEALDLAGVPLHAVDRDETHPVVVAGGHAAFNPEPVSDFVDCAVLGDGEQVVGDITDVVKAWKAQGSPGGRVELLARLARVDGVYVPALLRRLLRPGRRHRGGQAHPGRRPRAGRQAHRHGPRRVALPEDSRSCRWPRSVHERMSVEIFRGCTRGCRFCQAGMITRPVRERTITGIGSMVEQGLKATGYEEVGLLSLSAADHSEIGQLAKELADRYEGTNASLSLPSTRVDAFNVTLANELSRNGRRSGLTFAPEGGSERIRRVINKTVSKEDLVRTVTTAYANGWRQVKLYFMCGLPTETDEDVLEIAELAVEVIKAGREASGQKDIRCTVSIGGFVPKPHTPFQWASQASARDDRQPAPAAPPEDQRGPPHRPLHRPALPRRQARRDRRTALPRRPPRRPRHRAGLARRRQVRRLERALLLRPLDDGGRRGARGRSASTSTGSPPASAPSTRSCPGTTWTPGLDKEWLWDDWQEALNEEEVADCRWTPCYDCGVCPTMGTEIQIGPTGRSLLPLTVV